MRVPPARLQRTASLLHLLSNFNITGYDLHVICVQCFYACPIGQRQHRYLADQVTSGYARLVLWYVDYRYHIQFSH